MRRLNDILTGPWCDDEGGDAGSGADPSTAAALAEASQTDAGSPTGSGEDGSLPTQATESDAGSQAGAENGANGSQGWIPLDRHEAVLRNAREAAAGSAWAHGMDRERVARAMSEYEHRERDPMGYARHLQGQFGDEQEPGPDRQDQQTGELFYSLAQQHKRDEFLERRRQAQFESTLDQRVGPLEATNRQQAAESSVDNQLDVLYQQPGFRENVQPIADLVQAANDRGYSLPLWQAYAMTVIPALMKKREELVKDVRASILKEMSTGQDNNDTDPTRSAPSPRVKTERERSLADDLAAEYAAFEKQHA